MDQPGRVAALGRMPTDAVGVPGAVGMPFKVTR